MADSFPCTIYLMARNQQLPWNKITEAEKNVHILESYTEDLSRSQLKYILMWSLKL